MSTFFSELGFAVGMLVALGLAGGFVVRPFRARLPFVMLAAPLAGILAGVLTIATLYSVTTCSLRFCMWASFGLCSVLTIASFMLGSRPDRKRPCIWLLVAALLVVPLAVWTTNATSIYFHGHGLLYADGTDHLGYAQAADWIRTHTSLAIPDLASPDPYEWYPATLYRADPRFGSFFFLAVVGALRHLSGAFSYDIACGVVLSAGVLAVAGAFARSRVTLLILLVGLVSCHWYDYSRGGYFGKLLAYPSALLAIGLFLSIVDSPTLPLLLLVGLVTSGAALMHSGLATALFIATATVPLIGSRYLFTRRTGDSIGPLRDGAAGIGLLLGIAVITTGLLARPAHTKFPDFNVPWHYTLTRALDLGYQGVDTVPDFKANTHVYLTWMAVAAIGVWAILAAVAFKVRDSRSLGLLLGPLLLLGVLAAVNANAQTFQLIGMLYPMSLCGAAFLLDSLGTGEAVESRRWRVAGQAVVLVLAAGMIGLRVPRYLGVLDRFASEHVRRTQQYSKRLSDQLARKIGSAAVDVDIPDSTPNPAIYVLVELTQRHVAVQWTPASWRAVVGFANRPAPVYEHPGRYKLLLSADPHAEGGHVVFETPQYKLLDTEP